MSKGFIIPTTAIVAWLSQMKNQTRLLLLMLLFTITLAGFIRPSSAAISRHFDFYQNSAATGNGCQGQLNCFNSSSPVPLITVNQGDSITITAHNNDTTSHTFTFITAPYTSVDTGTMTPGQMKTVSFTANTAGPSFNYQCNFHPTDMKGQFKVNAAAPMSPITVLGLLITTVSAAYIVTRRRR